MSALAVTGAAGTIGSILLPHLAGARVVRALDLRAGAGVQGVVWLEGSVSDPALVEELLDGCDYAVHLATAARSAVWEQRADADIEGTRTLFDLAAKLGLRRVLYASSNHIVGMREADHFRGIVESPILASEPVRPDSEYGVTKAFGEAYGRFVAETTGTAVSCLRIGTVRTQDDPELSLADPLFAQIPGGREGVRERLARTWLYNGDLLRIVDEELAPDDDFRVRFCVSDFSRSLWSSEVYRWSRSADAPG